MLSSHPHPFRPPNPPLTRAAAPPLAVQVRRFYRPEDVSQDIAYRAGWWDLYAPQGLAEEAAGKASWGVAVDQVYGKCAVVIGAANRPEGEPWWP